MNTSNKLPTLNGTNAFPDVMREDHGQSEGLLKHEYRHDKGLNGVRSVNITGDRRYLIITYEKAVPRVRVVDLENLEFLPHRYEGHTASVRLTCITGDDRAFHTASWDASSRRFEIESGKSSHLLSGFGRSPSCFLHPDQKHLFIASYDADYYLDAKNNGRCFDLSSGKVVTFYRHTDERISPEAVDIAFNDGKVFTGSDDGTAVMWNYRNGRPVMKYFSFKGTVRKLAISKKYLAAACTDGMVRVHHKLSGKSHVWFLHGEKDVREVRISKDEARIWSATECGIVRCFNLVTGEMIYQRRVHSLWIWSMCLSKDEKLLITGSGDGTVAFLSADNGQVLARLHNMEGTDSLLISCPPDKTFPNGFFYTDNTYLINVYKNREDNIREYLGLEDLKREVYINRLNLRNLIITRLKNSGHYNSLTDNYLQNRKLLDQVTGRNLPQMLKA